MGGTVGDSDGEGVAGDTMGVGFVDDAGGEGAAGVFMGDGNVGVSVAGVSWVMLRVVGLLASLTTVRVRRCIEGVAGGVDCGGVVGDGECGGSSGDCETGNANGGGVVGDGRAAQEERRGQCRR